jgi:hypothetical protein
MNPRKTARLGAAVLNAAAMAVPASIPAFAGLSRGTSATGSTIHAFEAPNRAVLAVMERARRPRGDRRRGLGNRKSAAHGPG